MKSRCSIVCYFFFQKVESRQYTFISKKVTTLALWHHLMVGWAFILNTTNQQHQWQNIERVKVECSKSQTPLTPWTLQKRAVRHHSSTLWLGEFCPWPIVIGIGLTYMAKLCGNQFPRTFWLAHDLCRCALDKISSKYITVQRLTTATGNTRAIAGPPYHCHRRR